MILGLGLRQDCEFRHSETLSQCINKNNKMKLVCSLGFRTHVTLTHSARWLLFDDFFFEVLLFNFDAAPSAPSFAAFVSAVTAKSPCLTQGQYLGL